MQKLLPKGRVQRNTRPEHFVIRSSGIDLFSIFKMGDMGKTVKSSFLGVSRQMGVGHERHGCHTGLETLGRENSENFPARAVDDGFLYISGELRRYLYHKYHRFYGLSDAEIAIVVGKLNETGRLGAITTILDNDTRKEGGIYAPRRTCDYIVHRTRINVRRPCFSCRRVLRAIRPFRFRHRRSL